MIINQFISHSLWHVSDKIYLVKISGNGMEFRKKWVRALRELVLSEHKQTQQEFEFSTLIFMLLFT